MKCSIQGCPGEYELRTIVHTLRPAGGIVVINNVPAEVCTICGDVLLAPATIRQIEVVIQKTSVPERNVPLYEYA